jgi:HSP20 family protein
VLSGRREAPAVESDVYQQVEIERGTFRRVIELGAEVQADQAKARYEDGMLTVELPLLQTEAATRSVPIESAERGS